jgi:multiple sugar transport system ATP-binding protein
MTLAHRVALMLDGEIQQLASPETIYNDPANVFVAGFIGSPAMNLLPCSASNGMLHSISTVATAQGILTPKNGDITIGVRAEDARLSDHANAHLRAKVFACELLGESVMVTVKLGGLSFTIKTENDVRLGFGENVGIVLPENKLYWFDAVSGQRIRN